MRKYLAAPLLVGMALIGTLPMAPTTAATSTTDMVSVTAVLVNRLGGVNVQGLISCAGTAATIKAGNARYVGTELQSMDGQHEPITLAADDALLLLANSDNYVVRQPVGRKAVVEVTHASSRMNPCYTDLAVGPSGESINCAIGAVCPWRTDWFGWRDDQSLLWDYPSTGKFVANALSVTGSAVGLGIMVYREAHWYWTLLEDDVYLPYQQTLNARLYRG